MSDSTIGIKVADGSYYPVLDQGFTGRKKLILTTVKDNQEKVQIDLYRGDGKTVSEARYIGSLIIENIPPALQGAPEIELFLGIDREGQLSAEASDRRTGESQRFSISLTTLAEEDTYEVPEFEIETGKPADLDFEEPPLTGETYPVGETDRRKERIHRKGPNILLLILFVVLGVLLVAAIAYFVYQSMKGPEIPPLSAGGAVAAAEQPKTEVPAGPGQPSVGQSRQGTGGEAAVPAKEAESPKPAAKVGVTYRIKKGDTLWDIASTYYRNPWLYPRLAKANNIKNPDLIFAGTRIFIPED